MRALASRIAPIMLGRTILRDPARKADVARFNAVMTRRKDIWRAVNGVIDRPGVEGELQRIAAPTLVMVGDEDVATPRAKSERLVAGLKNARLVTIPRAGHSSSVEEPVAVSGALAEFLAHR
jgi:pimeloyl-ACP methyl ester carboxylesterase